MALPVPNKRKRKMGSRDWTTKSSTFNRRDFLATGARGGAALIIGFYLPWESAAKAEPQDQERALPNPFNTWIRINQQGQVTLIVEKSEMGQGVMTSLPMILADELEVEWSRVRVEQAPTNPKIYSHGTGGSGSVLDSYLPLRQAAAAAREMLIATAAQRWSVPPETCRAERGGVIHGPRKNRLEYSELVEAAAKLPIPDFKKVPLKNPTDFNIVGRSIPRVDVPAKVNGTAEYGIDVQVPEMLYAVVARCPTFGGRVARFDDAKAKAIPGVRQVFEIPALDRGTWTAGGVAVVADNTWTAIQGRRSLVIDWDFGPHANESTETLPRQFQSMMARPGKVIRSEGDTDKTLAGAKKKIAAAYELPFLAHATMEPMNCTVDIRSDRAEVWSPTQGPDWTLTSVARIAGLRTEAVAVPTTTMGGGCGRRYQADFVGEAAQIARVVRKPIKITWTREDDMQHDFYRPAAYHRLEAALDDNGKPSAWYHHVATTS